MNFEPEESKPKTTIYEIQPSPCRKDVDSDTLVRISQNMMTPEDLYHYYSNLSTKLGDCSFVKKLEYELMIDLKRTDPKNE
jgi:hypothetical protein